MTEPRILCTEKVRVYDKKSEGWRDGTLCAKSDGTVQYEVNMENGNSKREEIEIGPLVTTTRPERGNFDFVFVINTVKETTQTTGPRFATKELSSCERWISVLNLIAVRKKLKIAHPHPLTEVNVLENMSPCSICKKEEQISLTEENYSKVFSCEFCAYKECRECNKQMQNNSAEFVTSVHHPHPLMRLNSARGMWISSEYKGTYQCDRCDAVSTTTLYHCVECGDYDLCPKCTYERPEGEVVRGTEASGPARTPDELRLNEHFLAPVLKTEGTKYSLATSDKHICPMKMSVITYKCFNLDKIDTEVQPTAYMEVTFDKFNKDSTVGVGIGNQIFGQNNFLGHQQNSFGVFNNGTISMNNPDNEQSFPSIAFSAGDTIGIGVMKDSFNQRTVFFTKNGKKIGVFEWRVHTGMDCFPGVSFSKDSGAAFSVNFSGPFKCDLSQVAELRTDKDMLSTLPTEITEIIGAYSASSESRALQLREINKLFAKVMQSNMVWRALFLQKWPNQNAKLKVKSWQQFYRSRNNAVKEEYLDGAHPIDNCDFEFECPVLWENLEAKGVGDNKERFCDKCQKTVYAVGDVATMNRYTEMGRCVSLYDIDEDLRDMKRRPKKGKKVMPKAFIRVDPFD